LEAGVVEVVMEVALMVPVAQVVRKSEKNGRHARLVKYVRR